MMKGDCEVEIAEAMIVHNPLLSYRLIRKIGW